MNHANSESAFDEKIAAVLPSLEDYADFDLVIGIPFYFEKDKLVEVLRSVDAELQRWMGRRQLIVCAGDSSGKESLELIQSLKLQHPHIEFLMPPEASGRGMSIRAFLTIAKQLEADLLVFSSSMATEDRHGIEMSWLDGLLSPVQGKYDMVVGSMRRNLGKDSIAHLMVCPLLESFYGCRLSDPLGGIYAISHDFVEELASEAKFWTGIIDGFGIDFWLITRALVWNKQFCEINMGGRIRGQDLSRRNQIFSELALAVFECIRRDNAICLQERLVIQVVDILERSKVLKPDPVNYPVEELQASFLEKFPLCRDFMEKSLPQNIMTSLEESLLDEKLILKNELWVESLLSFLLYYAFEDEDKRTELLFALVTLYNASLANYNLQIKSFGQKIVNLNAEEQNEILLKKIETMRYGLTELFWQRKEDFNARWLQRAEQVKPPLVPLAYMEYVPGKPVVVPKKIAGKDKRIVNTDIINRELRKRYDDRFTTFIEKDLGLFSDAPSEQVITAVQQFMQEGERSLEELLPGDLYSKDGLKQYLDALFELLPSQRMYSISSDLLREMIIRFPPINLMIPLGYYKAAELIDNMDIRDVVSYANLVESWSYSDRDLGWLVDQVKPESFEWIDIKPIILSKDLRYGSLTHTKISNLNRLTARIAVKPLDEGRGGKYPRMRYFTSILRRLASAEHYSELFRLFVLERKNIALKMRNALLDVQKGDDFSASNIFENYHHRCLVNKLRHIADKIDGQGNAKLARVFHTMADGYGLSHVMENGEFLTCTSWSWASYSFKGGLKRPTPLTTSVETRWFNHDFLEALYEELGYNTGEIMQTVFRLIHSGKSGQSLLDVVMPARPKDVAVVVQENTDEPSHSLERFEGNPILEVIDEHNWECKYVLNPGALRIKDKVYLFYRAVGKDNVSHIGLAITDGYKVIQRLTEPIFSAATPEEKMGCEDPRLIIIKDKIWMLYTAYDGNIAQIAAASIQVKEFVAGKYKNWKREGLAFKNIWDKDAILFPEKINGKYILYHRIEPSMWITYMNEVEFPCREKHAIILGPRPGRMWDSLKIGAGAQPLKTKYGWLLIYHGVDYNYVYRLGVLLVDLNNARKVIYRSPNPILEPVEDYELGLSGAWVPNVVFTCGAVAGTDKEILEDDDEILVYYGAADTSIGMASARLKDLIPAKFRL